MPLILGDIVVPVEEEELEARAFDRASGSLRWTTPLPAPAASESGVVLDGGTLLLPLLDPNTRLGTVFALHSDGRLEGTLHEAPGLTEVYAVDGHILVGTNSEFVCFRLATPESGSRPGGKGH
ncbi:MAG: hypothetical protein E2O39_04120 [Planctomycetota bacterium]|nr:MAG: hypothetical protein E2O39_04120 [Planctomycetota bacterium]